MYADERGVPRFGFVVAGVDVGERLAVGVADDIAAGHFVSVPRRGEAAGWVGHGADCLPAELVARQRSDGWTPVASVRYGFRDDLARKFDVGRRFPRCSRGF
jgi:hypothetical protein